MPVRYWVQARMHIAISLHISEAKLPRPRPGRGQMLEAKAEAEAKFWPQGQSGFKALISLLRTQINHIM